MNPLNLRSWLCPALLTLGCADAGLEYAQHAAPIRNGTLQPQILQLTPGQQAAIGWIGDSATPDVAFCTGTLVGTRAVATARHCVESRGPEALRFGIGQDPAAGTDLLAVAEVHLHPTEDAALLVLAEDATKRIPGLTPIRPNDQLLTTDVVGLEVDVAGYGATNDPTRNGRWFAKVTVDDVTAQYLVVNGNGEQGLCFGDSGGPVLLPSVTGEPVVAGVEHAGEMSCVGVDQMTRLDAIGGWLTEVAAPALTQPCGAVDYVGRCAGDIAEWCDGELLARADCTQSGEVCGYLDADSGFYCAPKSRFPERGPQVARFVGGCNEAPGAPGWWALLLGAALLHRRE